ncbi:MAG: TolC family outer membrane protein [Chromatiales bacterium]|nr:TolC family outer membrane protein [Chromatiales bacterium]
MKKDSYGSIVKNTSGLLFAVMGLCAFAYAETATQPNTMRAAEKRGLLELYELATEHDMRYQASVANFEANSLEPNISRAQLLPSVSFRTNRTKVNDQKVRGVTFEGGGNFSYQRRNMTLSLDQSIFNRKYYIELAQSRSRAQRAQLELQSAQHDLMQRMVETYFTVLDSQTQLEFTRAKKEAVQRQLEQARARFDVGLATISDVKEAEASYDLTVANEISDETELSVNLSKLQVIINEHVWALKTISEDTPIVHPEPKNINAWVGTATEQNLELLAQKLTVNISEDEVKRQRANYFPTLDAYVRRNENETFGNIPTENTVRGTELGIELQIPLFSGGENYYRTKQASQFALENRKQLEETHRMIKQQAQESYLNVLASISRTQALARAVESAQSAYEANEIGFSVGTRSSVDVLLAVEELFAAKRDYITARHRYVVDLINLKRVAGILSATDIQQIDQWLR